MVARGKTSDVVTYFLNHNELAFMGGFIYAMNTRIEFITSLDSCWFSNDPAYVSEIRASISHLNSYIALIKRRIDAGFRVKVTTKFQIIDNTTKPPLKEPVSHTFTVVSDDGQVLFTETVPADDRQAGQTTANNVRRQHSLSRQAQVMAPYDQIATTWNNLVVNFASASIQRVLSPHRETTPVQVAPNSLEITALREIEPAGTLRTTDDDQEVAGLQPARDEYTLPVLRQACRHMTHRVTTRHVTTRPGTIG